MKFCFIVFSAVFLQILFSVLNGYNLDTEIIKEAFLEPTALISRYGYQAENHTVSTSDGFELTMHRIPGKRLSGNNSYGFPVLLMHGMNFQSNTWFYSGPESLAFILSDLGYDVWMGNFRGTYFSKHVKWTRTDKEFWDYSIDEHVLQDLPSMIDYVLKTTGYTKLVHVGQSLGTTVSFITLAALPEYNDKILGNIALGPTLSVKYAPSPMFVFMKKNVDLFLKFCKMFGIYTWMETGSFQRRMIFVFCPSDNPTFCQYSASMFSGFDPYLANTERIPLFVSAGSSGVSINAFVQILRATGPVTRFDYGPEENLKKYGSEKPPLVNMSNNVVPTVLFYGANDPATDPLDVVITSRYLKNLVAMELVPHPMVCHSDYTWAKDAKGLIYDKLVEYVQQWTDSFSG